MNGFIYKITNNINGKCYIGKTAATIEERFETHIKDSKRDYCKDRPLYRAFNKYGIENFSIEEVDCVPLELLSEREIYWIGYFHSYEDGYNATLGGDSKLLYSRDEIISLIKEEKTAKEICDIIGCCKDTVRDIAKKENLAIKPEETALQAEMKESKRQISQFDLSSNYLRDFDSASSAAKWLVENEYAKTYNGGVRSHILDVCKGLRKTAYKFKWEFK